MKPVVERLRLLYDITAIVSHFDKIVHSLSLSLLLAAVFFSTFFIYYVHGLKSQARFLNPFCPKIFFRDTPSKPTFLGTLRCWGYEKNSDAAEIKYFFCKM